MSKYSSSSFAVFLADGFNLLAQQVKNVSIKIEAGLERSDGLGDTWEAHTPTGLRKGTLTQGGAFFDDTANGCHLAFRAAQMVSRIVLVAPAGNVIGRLCYGFAGAFASAYEVLGSVGALTKANASYTISGIVQQGVLLQEWATRAVDWDTATEGNSVDNGAATTAGAVGYLEVSGFSGPNALTVTIQHASDGGGSGATWTNLISFTAVTGAQTAQRVEVSGTVNRWTRVRGTGFGHVSASASTSASISPSVSASASASPSRSPSASLSPSASTSASPSASLSPSSSVSPSSSASPTRSASASVSPSASQSQSASASPTAGAGPASSITLAVALARG